MKLMLVLVKKALQTPDTMPTSGSKCGNKSASMDNVPD